MLSQNQITNLCSVILISFLFYEVSADVNIITKSQWGGKEASGELISLEHPLRKIVVCHTASSECSTPNNCSTRMQIIQEYQMENKKFFDIGYNFLIGNDGNVYEGRGWDHQGAFAKNFNAGTLGIAFIGTFDRTKPTDEALQASQALIEKGVQLNKIASDYKLYGHRQMITTVSPGNALYNVIIQWPHWAESV